MNDFSYLGYGLGLRSEHYQYVEGNLPPVDWFEVISENYMTPGGAHLNILQRLAEHYPFVLHGVSLSIGSVDPLNQDYLKRLSHLIDWLKPKWISDHLCWTGYNHRTTHDLLPVPYTSEALSHIVSRINQVQEFLDREMLFENPSTYLTCRESTYTEWDFLNEMCQQTGCKLLLDVNNVYVSSYNHGLSPKEYIDNINGRSVQQIHLAGHTNQGDYIVDTHSADVIPEVWKLYEYTISKIGMVSTMIERDAEIPPFPELLSELSQARAIGQRVQETAAA